MTTHEIQIAIGVLLLIAFVPRVVRAYIRWRKAAM